MNGYRFFTNMCVIEEEACSCTDSEIPTKSDEIMEEIVPLGAMDRNNIDLKVGAEQQLQWRICPQTDGNNYHTLRDVGKSTNIVWQEHMVKKGDREKHLRQKGCVVWITGLSGSGKSTLACTLDHALLRRRRLSYVLDGDNMRHGLNNNLGFSAEDRTENIRRVGEVAKLFVDAGLICIVSFISPYRKDREACRKLFPTGDFIEVYLKVPLELCEMRDAKGLYKLARAGKIKCFTGIDDPYEEPQTCEIVLEPGDGFLASPEEMAAHLISFLEKNGYLQTSN